MLIIGETTVRQVGTAFVWTSGMSVDADGSPRAYAPVGSGLPTLDRLANAGKAGHWAGLACNGNGVPYVQQRGDRAPGYYVSSTALQNASKAVKDPDRYVNAEEIPYIAIPPELIAAGARKGDLAIVTYGALECAAIAGDVGPKREIGEGSMALARALGIPADARGGGVDSGVTYVLFTGSRSAIPWPREVSEFAAVASALFLAWGGYGRMSAAAAS